MGRRVSGLRQGIHRGDEPGQDGVLGGDEGGGRQRLEGEVVPQTEDQDQA